MASSSDIVRPDGVTIKYDECMRLHNIVFGEDPRRKFRFWSRKQKTKEDIQRLWNLRYKTGGIMAMDGISNKAMIDFLWEAYDIQFPKSQLLIATRTSIGPLPTHRDKVLFSIITGDLRWLHIHQPLGGSKESTTQSADRLLPGGSARTVLIPGLTLDYILKQQYSVLYEVNDSHFFGIEVCLPEDTPMHLFYHNSLFGVTLRDFQRGGATLTLTDMRKIMAID